MANKMELEPLRREWCEILGVKHTILTWAKWLRRIKDLYPESLQTAMAFIRQAPAHYPAYIRTVANELPPIRKQ